MTRTQRWMSGLVVLASLSQTGCFGKFALVDTLYRLNDKPDSKVVKSLLCWALVVIPVYAVSGLLDFLVFNVVEFYTGSNPVAAAPGTRRYATPDGREVTLALRREGEAVRGELTVTRAGVLLSVADIEVQNERVVLRQNGVTEVVAARAEGGKLSLQTRQDGVVVGFQEREEREVLLQADAAAVQAAGLAF